MMTSSPDKKTSEQRLRALRNLMKEQGITAFIQPHDDEFLGEYIPESAERIAYISNFSGSAGLAVITLEDACVFSDGRYTEQLKTEIFPNWQGKHIVENPPQNWLKSLLRTGDKVAYDPRILTLPSLKKWEKAGLEMVPVEKNLIDEIWTDRPVPPATEVKTHPIEFTGQTSFEKRLALGSFLKSQKEDAFLATDASAIAWALNLRASDLECLPIALGYALFHQNGEAEFFIDPTRLKGTLEDDKIKLFPADKISENLTLLKDKKIRFCPAETPVFLKSQIEKASAKAIEGENPLLLPRAIKNDLEIAGHKKAQRIDGASLVKFLSFVKKNNGADLSEVELADKLDNIRLSAPECQALSFGTISAVGKNAALPHYHAKKDTAAILNKNQMYLVDSGGQYPFGTTDCTRTIWSGPAEAPKELKEAFTRVLKGNIALSKARFPSGLPGYRLDTLARAPLWEGGLDYDHGTGHGVGSYLSVHEGPHSISPAPRPVGIEAGMIISNEPGYYEIGHYGIRIENLILAVKDGIGRNGKNHLKFETLTFVPIDQDLIDPTLLNKEELGWLNQYHAETLKYLSPLLEGDTLEWLKEACTPIKELHTPL
ncbi:aminopeptidase P family protein [Acetobacteraceae bacterium]|nr:aminopeptidase P family protein [Acetobacteraceae bacterium]